MEEEGNHFQTVAYVYVLDQVDYKHIYILIAYIIQLFLRYYNVYCSSMSKEHTLLLPPTSFHNFTFTQHPSPSHSNI